MASAVGPTRTEIPSARKKMIFRICRWTAIALVSVSALIWLARGLYIYWNDIRLLNFLAAWIPFVLSILLAFVPEQRMSKLKKYVWRTLVIAVGFAWSAVLWHQQIVNDATTKKDQMDMITKAVTQSNEHSDQRIVDVKQELGGVRNDLKDTNANMRKLVSDSTSTLSSSISKVGKPDPPEKAIVRFSLWPSQQEADDATVPIMKTALEPDGNGVFTISFTFANTSDVRVEEADTWIEVCKICEFAEEPVNFDRPTGLKETVRHLWIARLNPGASWAKQTIKVRLKDRPDPPTKFDIAFRYSCQACGRPSANQIATISILRPYVKPFMRK